jgi:phosphoribosyl-ATP pyrophosphohydrolase/phosphoribosyl-AMP cyclohydrolase
VANTDTPSSRIDYRRLRRTSGYVTFFSRTRNTLWTKGETSGNRLQVAQLLVDCDDDTLLVKVTRLGDGNVCHTGERTCFFRALA